MVDQQQLLDLLEYLLSKYNTSFVGTVSSAGIGKTLYVDIGGTILQATSINVDAPGEVAVIADSTGGFYCFKVAGVNLKRNRVITNRKFKHIGKKEAAGFGYVSPTEFTQEYQSSFYAYKNKYSIELISPLYIDMTPSAPAQLLPKTKIKKYRMLYVDYLYTMAQLHRLPENVEILESYVRQGGNLLYNHDIGTNLNAFGLISPNPGLTSEWIPTGNNPLTEGITTYVSQGASRWFVNPDSSWNIAFISDGFIDGVLTHPGVATVLYKKYGKGKIVAISDSNVFTVQAYDNPNNQRLLQNILKWLYKNGT